MVWTSFPQSPCPPGKLISVAGTSPECLRLSFLPYCTSVKGTPEAPLEFQEYIDFELQTKFCRVYLGLAEVGFSKSSVLVFFSLFSSFQRPSLCRMFAPMSLRLPPQRAYSFVVGVRHLSTLPSLCLPRCPFPSLYPPPRSPHLWPPVLAGPA